ncbi:MAG: family 16 glycoside hydrolase [Phycisphaerae bacterium]|nr:family 16 glycoside hydrolase [Phycisphaerae bacterium]
MIVLSSFGLLTALTFASAADIGDTLPDGRVLEPGLSLRIYEVGREMTEIPQLIPAQSPNDSRLIHTVDLQRNQRWSGIADRFYTNVEGWLIVPSDGEYEFELRSDDGSRFQLGGATVIDMNRIQPPTSARGRVKLTAGLHQLLVEHFDNGGGEELKLSWRTPGSDTLTVVPSTALRTLAGQVRVVSPGVKRVWSAADQLAPGDGRPLEDVHPSFDHVSLRPANFKPRVGGIAFLPDGRMLVCGWEPSGGVYVIDNVLTDTVGAPTVQRIAAGLAEPLGISVVDGRIFVLQKQELTELVDHDGDGITDEYRAVACGWAVTNNFHEFAFGLIPDGDAFLANLAIAINPGGRSTRPQVEGRGETIRIHRDGTHESVSHGLRTPNGIGRGADGHAYITDNQGDWLPSSKLMRVEKGAFFGSQSVLLDEAKELAVTPPVAWLPQNEIGNSPSQIAAIDMGPWKGQLAVGDVTHGGLNRVFVEEIDGVAQGCVFAFTQGLEAGVNRVVVGPDGSFYIGGIGANGDWGQTGKARFGLERLTFNDKPTFEPLAVRAASGGLDLEFTTPLGEGVGARAEDYRVRMWRYEPTEAYGGPKLDERELSIDGIALSSDRRRAFLAIDDLEANSVVYLRLFGREQWRDATGQLPWTTEAWYTMNVVPKSTNPLAAAAAPTLNTVSDSEARAGWRAIFDGATLEGWKNWKGTGPVKGWTIVDGTLMRSGDGGDLTTEADYANFELRYEWKVSPGGNSGVMFRATEDHGYPWETAPEMQVLDDTKHPDGRNPLTSAGSNYALQAPPGPVARPVGEWNTARILANGKHVTYWLNGVKTAEYEVDSEAWTKLVAGSKFAKMPDYGKRSSGKIVFQDHGDPVWFRNIIVRHIGDR